MNRIFSRLAIFVLTNLVLWTGAALQAAAPAGCDVKSVKIGFGGHFQLGSWTPVAVQVISKHSSPVEAHLTISAPDADAQIVHTDGPSRQLPPSQPQTLRARFVSGRADADITVRIESPDGVLFEETIRPNAKPDSRLRPGSRQDSAVWALCGLPFTAFEQFTTKVNAEPAQNQATSRLDEFVPELIPLTPADIPDNAADLASLDALVLATMSQTSDQSGTFLSKLTAQQQKALRDWVEIRGGHLMLSVGSHLADFKKSDLGQWLNLPLEAESSLRQLDGLESYSPHLSPLTVADTVPAIRLGHVNGNIMVRSLDGPLLVQLPYGFGRVTFLAVDLHSPPLAEWEGLGHLVRRALTAERDQVRELRIQNAQLTKSTINDLSSQLFAALEIFPGVIRLSLWSVMALMGVYILIVGPLDYLIVHRWLKRPHLTWFTLLIWVGLGSVLLVGLSNRLNGSHMRSTQLEIIDVDETTSRLRGQSWLTLYSPRTRRTSVELATVNSEWPRDKTEHPSTPLISWVAPAENRIGGLYREGGTQLSVREYSSAKVGLQEASTGYADVPLQVWSTARFGGEWSATLPKLVESKLTSTELGRLTGSIEHHLPGPLTDCMLAYANRVYMPIARRGRGEGQAELQPNFVWEFGSGQPVEQRELRSFLTQVFLKQVVRETTIKGSTEVVDLQTPYDPARRDIPYIVRMLTFHQASGGRDYTGLQHDVLGHCDMSAHLRLGRAVLFGRLQKSSAEWKVDGQNLAADSPQTYVRLVLPVDQEKAEEARALDKPDEGIHNQQSK